MDVVYFFYGLAFITLGITIFLQIRISGKSEFRLIDILWLLGWFGITHGAHECLDMFEIEKGPSFFYEIMAPLTLMVSYVTIFFFGYRLINLGRQRVLGVWFPIVTTLSFFALPLLQGITSYDLWLISARYFLGFPGAVLSAIGFVLYYRSISDKLEPMHVKKYFVLSAAAFGAYAVFGGLVVDRADFFPASVINKENFILLAGFPVEVLRAACAVAIALAVGYALDIFKHDAELKLKHSQEETRKANRKLEAANERLMKMDKAKDEFLSIVTHDLKSPLTAIMFNADALLDESMGKMTNKQRHSAESIKGSSRALAEMIDTVLEYTRVEFGRLSLEREAYSIASQVEEIAEEGRIVAARKGIALSVRLPKGHAEVEADRRVIRRVISNFVGNAIKHTPEGGSIEVALEMKKGEARVAVRDNGEGIAREHLARIFDKFYMITAEKAREKHSLGLGLYIAKNFVEAHGGRIWAESDGIGKGATFIFTLPAR